MIQSPCLEFEVYSICGGRGLFANHHNFCTGDYFVVYQTIEYLISELRRVQPTIEELIIKDKIKLDLFHYSVYNNSTEIIS
ncbi:MAG: hypothetical protein ACXACU_08900 [Candidatus Hodarchaeales archaeon]|jgi:hypothetical protein